jgi:hypothetical protein
MDWRILMTCGGAWRNPAAVKRDTEKCRHLLTFDLSYMVIAAFERDFPIIVLLAGNPTYFNSDPIPPLIS